MATKKKASAKADKGLAQPTAADRKAQAEQATPLEPIGPGVEHEDHEGGLTDSLAKKGVRGALATTDELAEQRQEEIKEGIVRAPSVRERQTGMAAALAQGGSVVQRDDVDAKGEVVAAPRGAAAVLASRPGARIIPVIATRVGQYPADGRLRLPGEAFDYVMGEKETKLPSWMKDARGELESRASDEPSQLEPEPVVLEVKSTAGGGTTITRRSGAGSRSVL